MLLEKLHGLKNNLSILKNQSNSWPRGLEFKVVEAYNQHNHDVFTFLSDWCDTTILGLIKHDDVIDKQIALLKKFLAIRNQLFGHTTLFYTNFPFLTANKACILAAETIAKPDEAVATLVMPTLKQIIGVWNPHDIKSASEDINNKFKLENFLMRDAETLLLVEDYLYYVQVHEHFAKSFFESEDQDMRIICEALGKPAIDYIEALSNMHAKPDVKINTNQENPPLFLSDYLKKLIEALFQSSVKRYGSEGQANLDICKNAIINFYHAWSSISTLDYYLAKSCRTRSAELTLEDYLLRIFASIPQINLSPEQYKRIQKFSVLDCTAYLSSILRSILDENLQLYNIPIGNAQRRKAVVTTNELYDLSRKLKEAIRHRPAVPGNNDGNGVALCALFRVADYFDERELGALLDPARYITSRIVNLEGLIKVLSSLSKNTYARYDFLLALGNTWINLLVDSHSLIQLFSLLNPLLSRLVIGKILKKTFFKLLEKNIFQQLASPLFEGFQQTLAKCTQEEIYSPEHFLQIYVLLNPDQYAGFLKNFSAEHLEAIFDSPDHRVGFSFLNTIRALSDHHTPTPPFFDKEKAIAALIKALLPVFLAPKIINRCWDKIPPPRCCGCFDFFSTQKSAEKSFWEKLISIYDSDPFEMSKNRFIVIAEFVARNDQSVLRMEIRNLFCDLFFQQMRPYVFSAAMREMREGVR